MFQPDVTQLTSRKQLVTAVLHCLREAASLDDQNTERQEDCFQEETEALTAATEAQFTAWHKQEWLTQRRNRGILRYFTHHLYQFIHKLQPYSNENGCPIRGIIQNTVKWVIKIIEDNIDLTTIKLNTTLQSWHLIKIVQFHTKLQRSASLWL